MSLGLYLKGQYAPGRHPVEAPAFDRKKLEELETWLTNVAFDELEWLSVSGGGNFFSRTWLSHFCL